MDENNMNGNVNPNEENNLNQQQTQATPEQNVEPTPEQNVEPTPEPQVQQDADQGAYNQQNQGYNQQNQGYNQAPPATDGKATASQVCGIVGFFCCGLVLGIIAVVLANQYFQETGDINNGKAKIDYDFCKGCGICAKICRIGAIEMEAERK